MQAALMPPARPLWRLLEIYDAISAPMPRFRAHSPTFIDFALIFKEMSRYQAPATIAGENSLQKCVLLCW